MPKDGSAFVTATAHYALFEQAEAFHQSLRQMLTGRSGPLTMMERYLWWRFYAARMRLRQQDRM